MTAKKMITNAPVIMAMNEKWRSSGRVKPTLRFVVWQTVLNVHITILTSPWRSSKIASEEKKTSIHSGTCLKKKVVNSSATSKC